MSLELREAQERLLAALIEERGNLDKARTRADVSKIEFYNWMESDPDFVTRYDKYMLMLGTEVEAEAVSRVMNPTANRGSDALAATVLKGLKRSRYGEADKQSAPTVIIWNSQLRNEPRPGADVVTVDAIPVGDATAALPVPSDDGAGEGDGREPVADPKPH